MSPTPAPPGLAQRLFGIVQTLRHIIAARAGRDRAAAPIVLLLWPYLHRVAARFDALVRKLQSGHIRAGTIRAAQPHTGQATAEHPPPSLSPRPRSPGLPRGFAWLLRLVPESAQLGTQVRVWLADPELAALLVTAPQAGRLLRPLCHMLGIDPAPDLPASLFHPPAPGRSPGQTLPDPASPLRQSPRLERPRLERPRLERPGPERPRLDSGAPEQPAARSPAVDRTAPRRALQSPALPGPSVPRPALPTRRGPLRIVSA